MSPTTLREREFLATFTGVNQIHRLSGDSTYWGITLLASLKIVGFVLCDGLDHWLTITKALISIQ